MIMLVYGVIKETEKKMSKAAVFQLSFFLTGEF